MSTLQITNSPETAFLSSSTGTPVFPIQDKSHFKLLSTVAALFGGSLQETPSFNVAPFSGDELVVALGEETGEAASLYAHLTLRQCIIVSSFEELQNLPKFPTIVVCLFTSLESALLEYLYINPPGTIYPGLIISPTKEGLWEQALARAAATYLQNVTLDSRVDFYPLVAVDCLKTQNRIVFGSKADPLTVSQSLAKGAGVVSIVSHSDGVDVFMGQKLTLCPQLSWSSSSPTERAPRCFDKKFCHRQSQEISSAIADGQLFPIQKLQAKVLILDVCSGMILNSGVIAPQWGIVAALLNNFSVGCIITRWSIIISAASSTSEIAGKIAAGESVGDVLRNLSRLSDKLSYKHRFCLIGDPRVRVNSLEERRLRETVEISSKLVSCKKSGVSEATERKSAKTASSKRCAFNSPALKTEHIESDLSLLKAIVNNAVTDGSAEAAFRRQQTFLIIQDYQRLIRQGAAPETAEEICGEKLRESVLRYLFYQDTVISKNWTKYIRFPVEAAKFSSCPHCNALTDGQTYSFQENKFNPRHLKICPLCGIIEDSPMGCELNFFLEDDQYIRLKSPLPANSLFGLHWGSAYRPENFGYLLPIAAGSDSTDRFRLPNFSERNPLRFSLICLYDTKIAVAGKFWRPPADS